MKNIFSFIHSRVGRRFFGLFVICALLPVCVLALLALQRVSAKLAVDSHERLRQAGKSAGMTIVEGMSLLQAELESLPIPSRDSWQASHTWNNKRFLDFTVKREGSEGVKIPGMPSNLTTAALTHLAARNALLFAGTDPRAIDTIHMATAANRNLPRHGLLVGEINPAYLWTLVGYTLPAGIDVCILGPAGKPLYASLPLPPALVSLVVSNQKGSSSGQLEWQLGEEDYLVNYRSLFLKPAYLADSWTVVAVQSKRDAVGPARSFITTFLLVVLLTLFVVIFVSSVFIRRSLVPLSILKDGARRLSMGDFDSRVEIASGDEFEDLAFSFNEMSAQLGNQFTRLDQMGRLVQRILATHDRDTIINVVMSCYRNSVSCEWLGLSLTEGNSTSMVLTTYNRSISNGVQADTEQFESPLCVEELATLLETAESLHVTTTQDFAVLLAPMRGEGAEEFFMLPISSKKKFLGVLILGYQSAEKQEREGLIRSRQIADEIAVALDNVRLIEELSLLSRGTIEVVANAVDAKSPWTAGHSKRVTKLALAIGEEMGLSHRDLEMLHLGGLFHDVGKIGIPEYILDKPGKLTADEYACIKTHPEKGAAMLGPIHAYKGAIPIVAQHHEQFNGQGYPLGLAGEGIALGARIMAVADVFDALYSNRPYRSGWDIDKVFSHLEEKSGSDFDPEVIKAFLKIDRTTYLELSTDAGLPVDLGVETTQKGRANACFET